MRKPTHPGKILKQHYIEPLNLDISWLADDMGVSQKTLLNILYGIKPVTKKIAQKLAKSFNTTPELWTNLQNKYNKNKNKGSVV